jgi:2-polyprenyl-6-methoxyphenol hydroxylase-like FAD-dependent oxidoreductase
LEVFLFYNIEDSAHTISPNSGQGASLALEDALYLAKLLKSYDYKDAFKLFELERKDRVEAIVLDGRRRGDDKEEVSYLKSKVREWFIWLFVGLFGKSGEKWVLDYKVKFN